MRCEEVIRELAAPMPGRDVAALMEHLDHCSACAEWSSRMASWDRLWNMTRPVEPTPEQWESVWNRIEATHASADSNTTVHASHAPLRIAPGSESQPSHEIKTGLAAPPLRTTRLLITIAAVIGTIAIGLRLFVGASHHYRSAPIQVALPGGSVKHATPAEPMLSENVVDIEEGPLVVIRTSDPVLANADAPSNIEVIQYEPEDFTGSWYVSWFGLFNDIESLVNPPVAFR